LNTHWPWITVCFGSLLTTMSKRDFFIVNVFLSLSEYRRLSCDLTLYCRPKIFNNLTPRSPSEYFNVSMAPYSLHSVYRDFNIRKPMCRTNSFEKNFFNRRVSAWNSLSSSLVKSKYVASFTYNLKSIDLSSFLNYVF